MRLLNCLKVFSSKRVAQIFLFLLLVFISTSFVTEWRAASRTQAIQRENEQNYQAIVNNAVLLNRCYVEKPDETYCFTVLKIIGSQLEAAQFQTENLKTIWFNCYMYLASVSLTPYPRLHDRIVSIAVGEEVIGGTVSDYTPTDKNKIITFQQELRATYRARIELEQNNATRHLFPHLPVFNSSTS